MRLHLVGGFLGSGKTTAVRNTCSELVERKHLKFLNIYYNQCKNRDNAYHFKKGDFRDHFINEPEIRVQNCREKIFCFPARIFPAYT